MNLTEKIINLCILCFISCFCIAQQSQEKNFETYRVVTRKTEDGLANGMAFCMLKDKNGFLWIGTKDGLSRFDGNVFKNYHPKNNDPTSISGELIEGIKEDSLHNLWIGTDKGLSRYDILADTFTNFLPVLEKDSLDNSIVPFWTTNDEVLCIESDSVITSFNIHSLKRKIVVRLNHRIHADHDIGVRNSIFEQATNTIWMLPDNEKGGLLEVSLSNGRQVQHTWSCYKNISNHNHWSEGMCYDGKRKCIWINTEDGFIQFTLADKEFLKVDPIMTAHGRGSAITIDNLNRIWVGTAREKEIMFVYTPETKNVFFPVKGDSDLQYAVNTTNSWIYCDRDNMIWIVYWTQEGKGITQLVPYFPSSLRYRRQADNRQDLSSSFVYSFKEMADGNIWLLAANALYKFHPATGFYSVIEKKEIKGLQQSKPITFFGIDNAEQKAWFRDDETRNWFELDINSRNYRPLLITDTSNKKISAIDMPDHQSLSFQNGIIFCGNNGNGQGVYILSKEDPVIRQVLALGKENIKRFNLIEDHLLIVTFEKTNTHAIFSFVNGKWTHSPNPLESVESDNLIYNGVDKSWWTSKDKQLDRYDEYFKITNTYTTNEGIPKDGNISFVTADASGNIWFTTQSRVSRLKLKTGKIITLSEKDGFEEQAYFPGWPIAKTKTGDLYVFGGYKGLDRIRPGKLIEIYPVSFVYVESFEVNQKKFPLSTGVNNLQQLSLRYFQNKISIGTGIIDYYSKGSSRIRYKLEGLNNDWQYAPANYTIRYEGLSPKKYILVMQASNAADDYDGPEKKLVINISPPFWQTWWFRTMAIVALLFIFYGIYRLRTATLRRQKRILEQTVKERTAEVVEEKAVIERQKDVIQTEKEKSDELLLNILPSEVAEELKEKGYTTAKSFDEVTVLFSDIKGFTNVAEKMTAQELVKEIDTYFSAFDNIILKYGLEKIKTIGDAYIAAGGLPEKNSATAQNVIEAAIAMQQEVEKLKGERVSSHKPYFELRIGIHTGPVVAGVVGIKKFQYDIWGDTVNLAARMEQSGVPGKINISEQTFELVKDQFTCVHRGKIEAKNKGEIDMYFVE